MAMTFERITTPDAPADDFPTVRDWLRVDGDFEDAVIADLIAAAARELEEAAGLALIEQEIRVTLDGWPELGRLVLPIAPALDVQSVSATADGEPVTAALITGLRPCVKLTPPAGVSPASRVVVTYTAGFGPDAASVPADLRQAIRDQVALAYDGRGQSAHDGRGALGGIAAASYAFQRAVGRYRRVGI